MTGKKTEAGKPEQTKALGWMVLGLVLTAAPSGLRAQSAMDQLKGQAGIGSEAQAPATPVVAREAAFKVDGRSEWIAAVKTFLDRMMAGGEIGNDLEQVQRKDLPDRAKAQYDDYAKTWAPEYPPQAYKVDEVPGGTAFLLVEITDGGTYMTVFDANGALIASGSEGESSNFSWDSEDEVQKAAAAIPAEAGATQGRGAVDRSVFPRFLGILTAAGGQIQATSRSDGFVHAAQRKYVPDLGVVVELSVHPQAGRMGGRIVDVKVDPSSGKIIDATELEGMPRQMSEADAAAFVNREIAWWLAQGK